MKFKNLKKIMCLALSALTLAPFTYVGAMKPTRPTSDHKSQPIPEDDYFPEDEYSKEETLLDIVYNLSEPKYKPVDRGDRPTLSSLGFSAIRMRQSPKNMGEALEATQFLVDVINKNFDTYASLPSRGKDLYTRFVKKITNESRFIFRIINDITKWERHDAALDYIRHDPNVSQISFSIIGKKSPEPLLELASYIAYTFISNLFKELLSFELNMGDLLLYASVTPFSPARTLDDVVHNAFKIYYTAYLKRGEYFKRKSEACFKALFE